MTVNGKIGTGVNTFGGGGKADGDVAAVVNGDGRIAGVGAVGDVVGCDVSLLGKSKSIQICGVYGKPEICRLTGLITVGRINRVSSDQYVITPDAGLRPVVTEVDVDIGVFLGGGGNTKAVVVNFTGVEKLNTKNRSAGGA